MFMDNEIYDMLNEIQIMIEMSYQMLSDNCDYLEGAMPAELLECYNKYAYRRNYIAMDYVHNMSKLVDKIQKMIDDSRLQGE